MCYTLFESKVFHKNMIFSEKGIKLKYSKRLFFRNQGVFMLVLRSFSELSQNDKPQKSEHELKKTTNEVKLRRDPIRDQTNCSPQTQTSHKNNIWEAGSIP